MPPATNRYRMNFTDWLLNRAPAYCLLWLREQGEFPVQQFNVLFDRQLTDLLRGVADETQHDQLVAHLGRDWVGEIMRSLRRAFQDENEVEEQTHRLAIKLVMNRKGLFTGWAGQPIEARFRTAVRNHVASVIAQRQSRRRNFPTVSMNPAMASMGEPSDDTLVQDFIEFVWERHGELAASVFQHRLAGGEIRGLFGRVGSRHAIKQAVKDVKEAAREFAVGDLEFQKMVEKAFADEATTTKKRRATMTARKTAK